MAFFQREILLSIFSNAFLSFVENLFDYYVGAGADLSLLQELVASHEKGLTAVVDRQAQPVTLTLPPHDAGKGGTKFIGKNPHVVEIARPVIV
ncbi:hypothetical protein HPP92_005909 [Vanilla planifolia]|uniref:Uncharacterized protein n=1 Tax=Vanilla planifolia TaxID=51239 RepID=A0A835RPJ2_VANPL|nr:hypothetical protein HPP92_005909 [Vanilla planifolia]